MIFFLFDNGRSKNGYRLAYAVVVSHEGIEGSQLRPSHTQLLGRVAVEAAHVGAHERDAVHLEVQHHCNRARHSAQGRQFCSDSDAKRRTYMYVSTGLEI